MSEKMIACNLDYEEISKLADKVEKGSLSKIKIKNGDSVKDSIKVTRRYHISDIMLSAAEGDTVVFTVERGGEETEVSINIGKGNFVQVK